MKNVLIGFGTVLCILLLPAAAMAELNVIVNSSVSDDSVTAKQVMDIYLGQSTSLPSGYKVMPVDQADGEQARVEFYTKVIKKDAAQLNAYWSRLIFTGKGQPPKLFTNNQDVIKQVSNNPRFVGYVSGSVNAPGVKVLLTIR